MKISTLTTQLQAAAIKYSEQQLGSFMTPEDNGLSLEDMVLQEVKEVDEVRFTGSGTYGQTRTMKLTFRNGRIDRTTRKHIGSVTAQVEAEFRFKMYADKTWQAEVELSV